MNIYGRDMLMMIVSASIFIEICSFVVGHIYKDFIDKAQICAGFIHGAFLYDLGRFVEEVNMINW